jgi:AmmeMemoRadiSam system protein A
MDEPDRHTPEQKAALLKLARDTIASRLKVTPPPGDTSDAELKEKRGAFVTLRKRGTLRGCIGEIEATEPLWDVVRKMAIQSAFHDPRFQTLSEAELDTIEIEISVLTPMEKVSGPEDIEIGVHGLLIRKGFNAGLLLPQVATRYDWDPVTFLEQTCHKAGLGTDDWKSDAQIQRFSAEIFSEKDI